MPYRSPEKPTGWETLIEAWRGNPQTLVPEEPRLAAVVMLRQIKHWQVAAENIKRGLYLVFGNMCLDSTNDTEWLNRQE